MIDSRIADEIERLNDALFSFGVSSDVVGLYSTIIENVAWMKIKLDDTREAIKNSSVAIPYDNGGGQVGIKENPLFKGYSALWKSYIAGMNQIISLIPEQKEEIIKEVENPRTVLELVMNKHKKGTA